MPPCKAAEGGEIVVWEKELSTNSSTGECGPGLVENGSTFRENPKLNAHGKQSKMTSADSMGARELLSSNNLSP